VRMFRLQRHRYVCCSCLHMQLAARPMPSSRHAGQVSPPFSACKRQGSRLAGAVTACTPQRHCGHLGQLHAQQALHDEPLQTARRTRRHCHRDKQAGAQGLPNRGSCSRSRYPCVTSHSKRPQTLNSRPRTQTLDSPPMLLCLYPPLSRLQLLQYTPIRNVSSRAAGVRETNDECVKYEGSGWKGSHHFHGCFLLVPRPTEQALRFLPPFYLSLLRQDPAGPPSKRPE